MRDYFFLLFWIPFLYGLCWFYNNVRRGTVLYEIDKKLAKILGFMKNGRKSSIFSIILGLYAHISLILIIVLGVYFAVMKVNVDMELVALIWGLLAWILGVTGMEIEVCISTQMAESLKQKIGFIILAILLFFSLGYSILILIMLSFPLIRN